jgi:hypothetical protein
MTRTPDVMSLLAAARPDGLDPAGTDGERRYRDLDRALSQRVEARSKRRNVSRWTGLGLSTGLPRGAFVAAGAAVAMVAGGAIVFTGGHDPAPKAGQTIAKAPTDARSFLLAAAETAAKAPAKTGSYWYTRVRTTEKVSILEDHTQQQKAMKKGKFGKIPPKLIKLPFTAYFSSTEDMWTGSSRSRTVVGIDNKTTFSPASGEAAWKKMGSPDLSNGKTPPSPIATDYAQPTRYRLGGQHVGLKTLTGLPADATALEATLRKYYAKDMHDQSTASGSWQTWVFGEAQDLLAGPITPGAKTALFQVLAKQPGIKLVGKVTDRLGRPGMAVAMPGDGGTFRLIIAPKTAEYLGDEFWGTTTQSTPDRSTSYQSMGWTDRLGGRP